MSERTPITNEDEVMEITPEMNSEEMVEGEIVYEQTDPSKIGEVEAEIFELQQLNPEVAAEVVNNSPEKAERITKNFNKVKAIAHILGDAAAIGIGAGVMIQNTDSHEHLVFNATNITVILATVASVFKLAWDLAGESSTENQKTKQPQAGY